jgi:hypothetical protein
MKVTWTLPFGEETWMPVRDAGVEVGGSVGIIPGDLQAANKNMLHKMTQTEMFLIRCMLTSCA